MNPRSLMTHRCTIQRDANAAAGEVAPGYDADVDFQDYLTGQPCRLWDASASPKRVTTDRDVVTHEWHMDVPRGTDVTEADRITTVTTKRGVPIQDGPLTIRLVMDHRSHKTLVLGEVS